MVSPAVMVLMSSTSGSSSLLLASGSSLIPACSVSAASASRSCDPFADGSCSTLSAWHMATDLMLGTARRGETWVGGQCWFKSIHSWCAWHFTYNLLASLPLGRSTYACLAPGAIYVYLELCVSINFGRVSVERQDLHILPRQCFKFWCLSAREGRSGYSYHNSVFLAQSFLPASDLCLQQYQTIVSLQMRQLPFGSSFCTKMIVSIGDGSDA